MPSLGLVLDIVLLGVLGAAIHRAWLLSRQFEQVKADRAAFEQLISALNIATARAAEAIDGLKAATHQAGDALQSKVNAARALEGELEIMLQAGDNLAERLQEAAIKSRQSSAAAAAPVAEVAPVRASGAAKPQEPRTRAEKELLDALRAKQDG